MSLSFVYITNGSKAEAKKIAKHLLDQKLIACANIFPINSLYWWKGSLADEKEFVLLGKTIKDNYGKIKEEVKKMHSYTIPCIIKLDMEANEEYGAWLEGEMKK